MAKDYDHTEIEKKWQERWNAEGIYATDESGTKDKYYVLDMFPYPSGAGLHVGHPKGYIASDVHARKKRMEGFAVLHPMGWDAFGLPAEGYAIKTGTPPRETTDKSIATFKHQISNLALSYDWAREFGTHTPEYYQWTQWLFLKFFEKGLVYKKKALVNWDPVDQTVLANEQVLADGTAERSGAKVEKKELAQWFFKITQYAEELVNDLDKVDWPDSTKINQRNWIGRSEGLIFSSPVKDSDLVLETFSTHFEAFYADTFVVIAPDHPLLPRLLEGVPDKDDILKGAAEMLQKRSIQDRGEVAEVEGIFTGRYTLDPLGNGELPIWIANYALADYGTGIVKCSAHDERDFRFAKKYGIRLKTVLYPQDAELREKVRNLEVCYADMAHGVLSEPIEFEGSVAGEHRAEIADHAVKKGLARKTVTYRLRDWLISRQRYWGAPIPIVYDPEGNPHAIPEKHLPWLLPEDVEYLPKGTSPLGSSKELRERVERIFGKGWTPEIDTVDTFVCSSWYYFRFADPHNDTQFASAEQLKKWLPVDLYVGGAEHTVLHLMYSRFFTKALRDMGYLSFDEPFLKLRHQGLIMAEDGRKMSKRWGNVINPDDVVARFGADSLRTYEMFMGPFEQQIAWSTNGVVGVRRFIERVFRLSEKVVQGGPDASEKLVHQTIKKVTDDIEAFRFNTAISQLMIAVNALDEHQTIDQDAYESILKLLAPFAPHVTDELWERLGHATSIHIEPWPTYDAAKLVGETVKIVVQVNGKTRGTFEAPRGMEESAAVTAARAVPAVEKALAGAEVGKVIYVPDRLINLVSGE